MRYAIIEKDGQKWLRPILDPSDIDQLSKFFQNPNNLPDLLYLGSRKVGDTVDETQVKQVHQLKPLSVWITIEKYNPNFDYTQGGFHEMRTAYVDVELSPTDRLIKHIENAGAKMTFGLTGKNMEVINRHIDRFDGAKYSYQVWQDIGKEIGWVPLAAALWYFERNK